MTVKLPLDKMTVREKLQVMETIWEDLSKNSDDLPSPAWHQDALEEREARIASGQAKFVDWEKAKKEIRRRVK